MYFPMNLGTTWLSRIGGALLQNLHSTFSPGCNVANEMCEPRGFEAPNLMNKQHLKRNTALESRTFGSVGSTQS